ncbi:MAG: toxin-antitoxin system HicB family antitoxin [Cyanobacteria bacterium P01_G01_bin.19]
MSVLTIRLPDEKHERLKALAKARGMSLNKLIEELSTIALAEYDAEIRFRALVARGNPQEGIAILDKLDAYFSHTKLEQK